MRPSPARATSPPRRMPGGVAALLLMLSGRAADAQAPNTCLTSTACLPEGATACSTTSECATGCTAGAAYAICTVDVGIAIDGQAYCLEGLAPGTNGAPTDVCTEPNAHSFIQARAAATLGTGGLHAARAFARTEPPDAFAPNVRAAVPRGRRPALLRHSVPRCAERFYWPRRGGRRS